MIKQVPASVIFSLPGLAALSFLIFAWPIGQYVERALLDNQRAQLQITAQGLAHSLSKDPRMLEAIDSTPTVSVYRSVPMMNEPVIDGRSDDWPADYQELGLDHLLEMQGTFDIDSLNYRLKLANDLDWLYIHLHVQDDFVVYRETGQLSVHRNDHVQLAMQTSSGQLQRFTIATRRPGEVSAMVLSSTGRPVRESEQITGFWLATESGYNLEIKVPVEMAGTRISIAVADIDDENHRDVKALVGLSQTKDVTALGRLVQSPTPMSQWIEGLPFAARIVDVGGDVLAESTMKVDGVVANQPIMDGARKLGEVELRQSAEPSIAMYRLVVMMISVAFALMLSIVAFGSFLAALLTQRRLKMLGKDVANLVEARGGSAGASMDDMLGDLQAELTEIYKKVAQYNDYLEKMAGQLNHELRTPISVIRSSIENLESLQLPDEASTYAGRATEGVARLTNILNKMSEARRLEESLDPEAVVRMNLSELIRGCVAGYSSAYPETNFDLSIEAAEAPVTGIPELLAQMLDKFIDNAVSFSSNHAVRIRLTVEADEAVLRIMNEGELLPDVEEDALFASMMSGREDGGGYHLGLGLYIARLIAEFHGGRIAIRNRDDVQGVMVSVNIPLLRITTKLL